MNEQSCASESSEGSVGSTAPEGEVVPVTKLPAPRAYLVHALERTARWAETIRAINRPLVVSQQLTETMRGINRPLAVSQQLSETISAAANGSLVSKRMAATIAAADGSLVSKRLSATIAAANGSLVSKRMQASYSRAVSPSRFWSKCPSDTRTDEALEFTPQSIRSPEKLTLRPDSEVVDTEDYPFATDRLYWLTQFDALIREFGLIQVCRSLFADGYYDLAVQRACTYLHNVVREKSARYDKDGADLMMAVFSPKNPTLLLNQLTTPSEKNEQQGYMFILAGTMTGIRNPRSHEHDLEDSPEEALEILVLVNHLMRRLNNSALA